MVFMVYALHDFERPVAFLRNLTTGLGPGGTVIILDRDPERSDDDHHFLPRERLEELFAEAGYELLQSWDFLERDLLMEFRPLGVEDALDRTDPACSD